MVNGKEDIIEDFLDSEDFVTILDEHEDAALAGIFKSSWDRDKVSYKKSVLSKEEPRTPTKEVTSSPRFLNLLPSLRLSTSYIKGNYILVWFDSQHILRYVRIL